MLKWSVAAVALLGLTAEAAQAQGPQSPPPPSERLLGGGRNPAVTHLMQAYRISEEVAQDRIEIQNEVVELAKRLNAESDPNYAGIWIEHEPVYRVVVAFADQQDRREFRTSLSPRLQRHVKIIPVAKSRRQSDQDTQQLIASLRALGDDFSGWFDETTQRFVVGVETAGARGKALQLIPPQLRGQVDVVVKKLPKPEVGPPTGVQSGDFIAGGYWVYISTDPAHPNPAQCTFGFPVRYGPSRLPGVLTAAHCYNPLQPTPIAYWYNGHWIRFDAANPIVRKYETTYDYMVLEGSPTLGDDGIYDVYFVNTHNIPGVTGNYYDVTAYVARTSLKSGDALCKSGRRTGLTCGTVKTITGFHNGWGYWIIVSNTTQPDLSAPGDSGGPWFMNPGTGSQIIAAGIHSDGTPDCVGATCEAVVMPIDYIDDHNSTIKLPSTP